MWRSISNPSSVYFLVRVKVKSSYVSRNSFVKNWVHKFQGSHHRLNIVDSSTKVGTVSRRGFFSREWSVRGHCSSVLRRTGFVTVPSVYGGFYHGNWADTDPVVLTLFLFRNQSEPLILFFHKNKQTQTKDYCLLLSILWVVYTNSFVTVITL